MTSSRQKPVRALSLLAALLLIALSLAFMVPSASASTQPSPSASTKPSPSASTKPSSTGSAKPSPKPSATAEAPDLNDLTPVVSKAGFTHPGVFDSLDNLTISKQHVLAGDAPWADSFTQLSKSEHITRKAPDFKRFGSAKASDPLKKTCSAKDRDGCITVCGSFNKDPNVGCDDQRADSRAVNALALMYWYTGDEKYAQRAVAILNAYSKHFAGNTGSNGPLMTAWMAAQMVRGAELLRYTYTPTSPKHQFDVDGFSKMLRKRIVPTLTDFDYGRLNGNWKLSAAEGLMNVGVFLDDRGLYNKALKMWRERVESYVYLSTDGELPATPENAAKMYRTPTDLRCQWLAGRADACQNEPKSDPGVRFQNGQNQESCRDFGHASMGLGGIINTAETAWIQGDDLYGEQQPRIVAGVLYTVQIAQNYSSRGWPAGFCAGSDDLSENLSLVELPVNTVFNAYSIRKGVKLPAISIPGYPAPTTGSDPLGDFIANDERTTGYVGNVTSWDDLTHHLASVPYTPRKTDADDKRDAEVTPSPSPTPSASADSGVDLLRVGTSVFAIIGLVATLWVLYRIGTWLVSRRRE